MWKIRGRFSHSLRGYWLGLMQTDWTLIEHWWIGSPSEVILVTVDRGRPMFYVYCMLLYNRLCIYCRYQELNANLFFVAAVVMVGWGFSIVVAPWWRHQMETFSALLAICAGNSPVTGEFPAQRPVTRSFLVFFDLRLNKRLSKQSWGWWFETPSRSLWHHRNVISFRVTLLALCHCRWKDSGPWFNINMSSYQHRKSHRGDKTVVRSSYLHSGISYTGKMIYLYWFTPLISYQPTQTYTTTKQSDVHISWDELFLCSVHIVSSWWILGIRLSTFITGYLRGTGAMARLSQWASYQIRKIADCACGRECRERFTRHQL